jgi:hypothetical protein
VDFVHLCGISVNLSLGLLARYYAARHSHGHYRSSAVTGVYHFTRDQIKSFLEPLKYALRETIKQHPGLCFSLVEKTAESDTHFLRLPTISWEDVVQFQTSNASEEDGDSALSKLLRIGHQHLWKDTSKPVWKVIVLSHTNSTQRLRSRVDIAFLAHHAIADGGSGAAFHKSFHRFLSQASTIPNLHSEWPYQVHSSTTIPTAVEEAITLPTPATFSPPPPKHSAWTAIPPFLPTTPEILTRIHLITIPHPQVVNILRTTRRLAITLTGLLHALILTYLSRSVPSATAFRAVTPYTMRRFTGVSDDEILNHISYITTNWDIALLTTLRNGTNDTEDEKTFVKVAQQFQSEITSELARVPIQGPKALIELAQIENFDGLCEEGMKRERGCTYEVSNVGVVKIAGGTEVKLEKLVFTQCAMVAGPAFGCSVISTLDGPLVLSLTWQEGVLEEEFVREMKAFLEVKLLGSEA